MLVCQDETWINELHARTDYGYGKRGMRLKKALKRLYNARSVGVLGATSVEGVLHDATFMTTNFLDHVVFQKWFEEQLLPCCNAFPGKRSVIIIDSASFHDFPRLVSAAAARGVFVVTFPPRCPNDNPIELVWSMLDQQMEVGGDKAFLRDPQAAILAAMHAIDSKHVRSCYEHCGLAIRSTDL